MSSQMLYLIGVPGSGKSTVMRELLAGQRRRVSTVPFAHTVYENGVVQLGRERLEHPGTDCLAMNVQPRVLAMLETGYWPRIVGEGDRLANVRFFEQTRARGYLLEVVLLDCPEEVAAERRGDRGSEQDEKWLRSRVTKVENLRKWATHELDATLPVAELAQALSVHPVLVGEEE
jgi:dephospho-CoA kinase